MKASILEFFRFGIRKGAKEPGALPEAMRQEDGDPTERKANVKQNFVVIGRLDLRPGEINFFHNESPGFTFSLLFALQVFFRSYFFKEGRNFPIMKGKGVENYIHVGGWNAQNLSLGVSTKLKLW